MANTDPFTPEEVAQILEAFFETVGTRQYIGARYVPIFGRKGEESIVWDNTKPYEPLTIVLYQGNSFTSRQYVPEGVAITNEEFWAETGNYNAQIEQYRIAATRALEVAESAQDNIDNLLPKADFSADSTVKDYVDDAEAKAKSYASFGKRPINDFIGTVIHSMTSDECERYASIGIRRIRTDLTWAEIETQRGVYDFSRFDPIIETAEANGMKLLLILDYNNALYAESASVPITTTANITAFANFVSAAVARYQGKDVDWEIWNEPNHSYTAEQYYNLVSTISPIIRSIDATGNALVGSIAVDGENSLSWWNDCCAKGILNYADKVSIHLYDMPTPERAMLVHLQNFTAITAQHNYYKKHMPWVISEIGYNTYSGTTNAPTDTERGAYEVRQIMLALLLNVDSLYIYEGKSAYSGTNSEAYFGLFVNGAVPTETANTIAEFMNELIEDRLCGSFQAPDNRYCLDFVTSDSQHKYVSWYASSAGAPIITNVIPNGCIPHVMSLYDESLHLIKAGVKNLGTHAETFNDSNTATGRYSHAEGQQNIASGLASHAEGFQTTASSNQAHSEGSNTTASGQFSHAGGQGSIARESRSFAHGFNALAANDCAVAFGQGTETGRNWQFVCGRYNLPSDTYAFSIGNGTDPDNKKNIFSVTTDGKLRVPNTEGNLYYIYVDASGQLVVSRTI